MLKNQLGQIHNTAYIDGANLDKGIQHLGWELDYSRFRTWLKERHRVSDAYLFLGYIPKFDDLYKRLTIFGYNLVFKEVVLDANQLPKGNCDADLVLEAVRVFYEDTYDKAVLVSSDGDYARLVNFLYVHGRLKIILSPTDYCSRLLRKMTPPLTYLSQMQSLLEAKKKNSPLETKH